MPRTSTRSPRSTCAPRVRIVEAKHRTLHLLDVENLAGGTGGHHGSLSLALADALAAYRETVAVAVGDHVVIGSGPTAAHAAGTCWPGSRLVLGRGLDGADRALLDDVDVARTAARYGRVVVASGDHAFCGLVGALRAGGLAVLVVARRGSVSRDLARLATVRHLVAPAGLALAA